MELRQLEYFVAVVEEASFTKAARRLHVAQPGVSAQIRRLERELGQELLDRSGRTVQVTEVGSAVLPYARASLQAAAGVRLVVDEFTGLMRGHLAVGMVPSATGLVGLPRLLADFNRRHPAVEITVTEAGSEELIRSVQSGALDVAFAGLAAEPPHGIAAQVVVDERAVAVVSKNDPLARRSTIQLEALAGRDLIVLPPGSGMRMRIDAAFAALGVKPRVAFEAGDPQVLAQLASSALGVAIVPESVLRTHAQDVHGLKIVNPALRGVLVLAWRTAGATNPAARAFIAQARDALPEPGAGTTERAGSG